MIPATTLFDASVFLDDPASQAELLADAVASGDAVYLSHALDVVELAQSRVKRNSKGKR